MSPTYQLETIPLWEAYREVATGNTANNTAGEVAQSEANPPETLSATTQASAKPTSHSCPFCHLQKKSEQDYLRFYLGPSVMNPEHRVELNSTGFCADHLWKLLAQRKNHSYSLAMHTYLQTLMGTHATVLSPQAKSAKQAVKGAQRLEKELGQCLVCKGIAKRMDRYGATAAHLWSKDPEFKPVFEQQHICLQHLPLLIYRGADMLRGKELQGYIASIGKLMKQTTTTLEQDIHHYTQMYKGENQGKDWGRAEGALERLIAFLGGDLR